MEVWKDIYFIENGIEYDYRGLYQVSSEGRVKSLMDNHGNKRERILKPRKHKNGYKFVSLYKDGKEKMFRVHRLVAHMFIENDDIENKTEVNHKDENKENNSAENLEWCTRKQNTNHGTRNKRSAKTRSRKVIGYSTTSTKVIVLQSTRQAEKFGFNNGNISQACRGKYFGSHEYKGYKWYYMN